MFDGINFDQYGWGGPQGAALFQGADPYQAERDQQAQQLGLPTGLNESDYMAAFQQLMASPEWAALQQSRQEANAAQSAATWDQYQEGKDDRFNKFLTAAALGLGGAGLVAALGPGVAGAAGGAAGGGGAATAGLSEIGLPAGVGYLPGGTASLAGGTGGIGAGMGGILDSSGAVIPGTEAIASGGGNLWQNFMSGMGGNWGTLAGGLLGAIDANNQPDSISQIYAPDPALTGGGNDVLAQLRAIFANGGPAVAGADPASLAAIQGLQGFAGGGGINPYLDSVFNTTADATRSRLSSEFARSGRNVGGVDHQGFRSDELQNLAAGIYGPGWESERQRQFSSLIPLLGGGDYLRGITQQQMDQPLTNAMRYSGGLNSLLPLFPGTNTQPLFNNPWAGFLGGAQLGSLFSGGGG